MVPLAKLAMPDSLNIVQQSLLQDLGFSLREGLTSELSNVTIHHISLRFTLLVYDTCRYSSQCISWLPS